MFTDRRKFLQMGVMAAVSILLLPKIACYISENDKKLRGKFMSISDEEWKSRLSEDQYDVLRKEGTERAGTNPLNDEKREGVFVCVACENPLFSSETKYESGTGWPSFYDHLPDAIETKLDFKLILPRTEYHCARCGGHQGHVFKDGPEPTGLRYCNNGVALKFIPKEH